MASIFDIRRENLRRLFREHGGASELSRKLGYTNPSFMTQVAGPNPTRRVTDKNARRYEKELGLPEWWIDTAHDATPDVPPAPAAAVDTAVIADVIRLVGSVLQDEKVDLGPSRFADVAALAVQDTIEHGGQPREAHIRSVVRLLKQ